MDRLADRGTLAPKSLRHFDAVTLSASGSLATGARSSPGTRPWLLLAHQLLKQVPALTQTVPGPCLAPSPLPALTAEQPTFTCLSRPHLPRPGEGGGGKWWGKVMLPF